MENNDENTMTQNTNDLSKLLFVHKLNSCKSQKNFIKSKINQYFLLPEKYFHQKPLIVINKKIKIKELTPIKHLNYNMLNDASKSTKYKARLSNINAININRNTTNENEKDLKKPIKNNEIIDNEKLRMIFNSYRNRKNLKIIKDKLINSGENKIDLTKEQENKELFAPELCDKNIPRELSLDLDIQKRRLKKKEKLEKRSRQMAKYLSNKINKNENSLLFNSVHIYRYKKQILESNNTSNKTNLDNNSQSYLLNWVSSLRRPKNYNGKYITYINVVGNINDPLWSTSVEKYPNIKEISVKSGVNLKIQDYKNFINNRKINLSKEDNIKNVENLDNINIRGKKLYNLEYKREMSCDKNKILYKSFVDNGKIIMYKDVNSIYGHETFYKNYFGRNKKKYINQNLSGSQSMQDLRKNRLFKF